MKVSESQNSTAALRLIEQLAAAKKEFDSSSIQLRGKIQAPASEGEPIAGKIGKGALIDIRC